MPGKKGHALRRFVAAETKLAMFAAFVFAFAVLVYVMTMTLAQVVPMTPSGPAYLNRELGYVVVGTGLLAIVLFVPGAIAAVVALARKHIGGNDDGRE